MIVNFVGEKRSPITFNVWFAHLNQKVGAMVMFDYSLGRGFFLLKFDRHTIVKKLLMLTPYKTSWGLGIFQKWVPSLNLSYPKGMQMHISTWITLKKLLAKF
jgi:hypothetical protein